MRIETTGGRELERHSEAQRTEAHASTGGRSIRGRASARGSCALSAHPDASVHAAPREPLAPGRSRAGRQPAHPHERGRHPARTQVLQATRAAARATVRPEMLLMVLLPRTYHILARASTSGLLTAECRLETLETSTHDAAEFERWQREMRERDESEELVAAQKRALENRLTRERAVLKQFDLQEQRKQEADRIRAEVRAPLLVLVASDQ